MSTLSRKLSHLNNAEIMVERCYSTQEAAFYNDVYKWKLYIIYPGPDLRYNPGTKTLSPHEVTSLISNLELCYQEMLTLEHQTFNGKYIKHFGFDIELVSENGRSEVSFLISSGTFTFRDRFFNKESILKFIDELKSADRIGKELIEDYKRLNPSEYAHLKDSLLGSGSGCFIATAVYGSPYAPEVMVLRHFRDNVLCKFSAGRILISFYYIISPGIASFIASHEPVQLLTRHMFGTIVFALQKLISLSTKRN